MLTRFHSRTGTKTGTSHPTAADRAWATGISSKHFGGDGGSRSRLASCTAAQAIFVVGLREQALATPGQRVERWREGGLARRQYSSPTEPNEILLTA